MDGELTRLLEAAAQGDEEAQRRLGAATPTTCCFCAADIGQSGWAWGRIELDAGRHAPTICEECMVEAWAAHSSERRG